MDLTKFSARPNIWSIEIEKFLSLIYGSNFEFKLLECMKRAKHEAGKYAIIRFDKLIIKGKIITNPIQSENPPYPQTLR